VGVHILVDKADPQARGYWDKDYVLRSKFDEESLVQYLLTETPVSVITTPWLGGKTDVWTSYRNGLLGAYQKAKDLGQERRFEDIMKSFRMIEANIPRKSICKGTKESKRNAVLWCRKNLPDTALDWLDTVAPGAQFTDLPLTGFAGLVSGKSALASKWAKSLLQDVQFNPKRNNREHIRGLLFGNCQEQKITGSGLSSIKPVNAAWQKDTIAAAANPWEAILAIEGMHLFSSSVVRRIGSHGLRGRVLGTPWSFGPAKESEVWIPTWSAAAKLSTLKHLFAEGRSQVGRNAANSALGFALATNTGVDKGIDGFLRFQHFEGNGQATFLTYMGAYKTSFDPDPKRMALADILHWYNQVPTRGKRNAADRSGSRHFSFYVKLHQVLDQVIKGVRPLKDVFLEIGQVMYKLSSVSDREDIPPVSLSKLWLKLVQEEDDCPELRLAMALASSYTFLPGKSNSMRRFRDYVFHTQNQGYKTIWEEERAGHTVWLWNDAEKSLEKLLRRWSIEISSSRELQHYVNAQLPDIDMFIHSDDFDMRKFDQYIKSCALVNFYGWESPSAEQQEQQEEERKSARPFPLYYMLKLCFSEHPIGDVRIPHTTQPLILALQGNAQRSSEGAIRRLRGSGISIRGNALPLAPGNGSRFSGGAALARKAALAALLPISPDLQKTLVYRVQQ